MLRAMKRGRSTILSTHILDLTVGLRDQIVLLSNGRLHTTIGSTRFPTVSNACCRPRTCSHCVPKACGGSSRWLCGARWHPGDDRDLPGQVRVPRGRVFPAAFGLQLGLIWWLCPVMAFMPAVIKTALAAGLIRLRGSRSHHARPRVDAHHPWIPELPGTG